MKKSDLIFILKSIVTWKLVLIFVTLFAIRFIPLQKNFLGGGVENYLSNPIIWSWANFDGEHYLSIVQEGYRPLSYFFFPLYPILIRFFSLILGKSVFSYLVSGLLLSHIFLFLGMVGFYKLMSLDYQERAVKYAMILLILFPTSFYFGSVYTESLFFALTVWSFFFARKRNWIMAGILSALAGATRIVGLALFFGLLIEWWQYSRTIKDKAKTYSSLICVLLSFLGIGSYLFFLYLKTGNPLIFLTTVDVFGPQRSSHLIILPQVFYRYIFKILPNLNYSYFFGVFTTLFEFATSILFLILSVMAPFKLRLGYVFFLLLGYLIPTLSGSFSSLPRYVLVLFPGFILMSTYFDKVSKPFKIAIYCVLFACLTISTALFVRGYWLS